MENPEGDGTLAREVLGNAQAEYVCQLCVLAAKVGTHFSIENPKSSYLFKGRAILNLTQVVNCHFVDFDQCMYGLQLPGAACNTYCRKATRIVTSFPALGQLARVCPGPKLSHQHEHAWGNRSVGGKNIKLSRAAGKSPPCLCVEWARILKHHVDTRGSAPCLKCR